MAVMSGTISEPLDFAPTGAMLAAAIDELRELGPRGGGAVEAGVRERALRAFLHAQRERTAFPPGWRHDYAKLDFAGLEWSSGRARVPALPRMTGARSEDGDVPALAVDNAGGIVHAGSTYLEPFESAADPRVRSAALADARDAAAATHLQIVAPETDRFTALATAFQNCGAYVEVPSGVSPAALRPVAHQNQLRRKLPRHQRKDLHHVHHPLNRPEIREMHQDRFIRSRQLPSRLRPRRLVLDGHILVAVHKVRDHLDGPRDAEVFDRFFL